MSCRLAPSHPGRWFATLLGAVLWLAGGPSALGDPPGSPGEMLEVAQLNDVHFLDAERGWAVGNRGVIWQTIDGGRRWQLVDSPATCHLQSITFCDEAHGWIVGGWVHPITFKSSGLILRTENGGRRWTRVDNPSLPALKWIDFRDPRTGWAVGNSSALYPAGAFYSDDGGFAWHSLPVPDRIPLSTATMVRGDQLLAVDRDDFLWLLNGTRREPSQRPATDGRRVQDLIVDGVHGWAVGDGGLLLASHDGGQSWTTPRRPLPEEVSREFDWRTVFVRGSQCWIAGSPGSCVLYSPDAGSTWQLFPTGHTVPLRRLHFVDDKNGWAVGEFGTILGTADGGRTWQVQRQGGQRAALLGMFATSQAVPWELLAGAAADDGYCTVATLLTRPQDQGAPETTTEDRFREAALSVGASSDAAAWRFPLAVESIPSPEALLGRWDKGRPGTAIQRLDEYLVKQIRLWRPDVIVTDPVSAGDSQPLNHLTSQLVMHAAQRAGDAGVYPEQIITGRLEPWSAKKVFSVAPLPSGSSQSATIDPDRLAVHLGCSLAHYAYVARGLMSPRLEAPCLDLRLIQSTIAQESSGREMFSGIAVSPIGESRRSPVRYGSVNLDSLSRMLQKQRQVQQLLLSDGDNAQGPDALLAEVDRLQQDLTPHFAGIFLHGLAHRLISRGKIRAAAQVHESLLAKYPQNLLAEASLLWLFRYQSSAEWQQAFAGPPSITRIPPTVAATVDEPARLINAPPDALTRSLQLANTMRQHDVPLAQEHYVQFPLASVQRRVGADKEAVRVLRGLSHMPLSVGWQLPAEVELWLSGERNQPTLPALEITTTTLGKPYLDGRLDDELWQQAAAAELPAITEGAIPATRVLCARDDEHLYFGIISQRSQPPVASSTTAARPRDADLSQRDRVELLLDIDRDYQSCYRLTVDDRGWTFDSCDEVGAWNPRWHVASSGDPQYWIAEIAIPWQQLLAQPPADSEVWAFKIRRLVPQAGVQSWPPSPRALPVARDEPTARLEGCGFLFWR